MITQSKVFVRLLDEDIAVWRPVDATEIELNVYEILSQEIPEDETWEFRPGERVMVEIKENKDGSFLGAVKSV